MSICENNTSPLPLPFLLLLAAISTSFIGPSHGVKSMEMDNSISSFCLRGMPYMVEGRPVTCTNKACPDKYQCDFNPDKKNYYCCSKENVLVPGAHGCPHGNALLFPTTGQPVQCNDKGDLHQCPPNFVCLPHVRTKVLQCCTTT